jgi:hypothetical protein
LTGWSDSSTEVDTYAELLEIVSPRKGMLVIVKSVTYAGTDKVGLYRYNGTTWILELLGDAPPVAISDLAATVGATEVVLAWTAPDTDDLKSVELQVKESTADDTEFVKATYTVTDADMKTATTATATGLTNDTAYSFRLLVIGGGNAGVSNVVEATPVAGE